MNIAAEELGYTSDQLQQFLKDIEQGRILARDAVPAIARGMRKMAAPGLMKALDNLDRHQTRMINAFNELKIAVGESGLLEALGFLFRGLEDVFKGAKPLGELLGATLKPILWGLVSPIRILFALLHDLALLIDKIGESIGIDKLSSQIMSIAGTVAGLTALYKIFKKLWGMIKSVGSFFGLGNSDGGDGGDGDKGGSKSKMKDKVKKGLFKRMAFAAANSGPMLPLTVGAAVGSHLHSNTKESGATRNTLMGDWNIKVSLDENATSMGLRADVDKANMSVQE